MSAAAPLLAGARNFRAVKPYEAADGRKLRAATLFRSGELSRLSAADLNTLAGLHIKLVCDLRSPREQGEYPSAWPVTAPRHLILPDAARDDAGPEAIFRLIDTHEGERGAVLAMDRLYRRKPLIFAPALRALTGEILAGGALPLLIHCHAGKDRTGFIIAMLLAILGVSLADIMDDYETTARFFPEDKEISQITEWARRGYGHHLTVIKARPLVQSRPDYLAASFDEITRIHGGVEGYVAAALGLDADMVAQLRDILLT